MFHGINILADKAFIYSMNTKALCFQSFSQSIPTLSVILYGWYWNNYFMHISLILPTTLQAKH